MRIPSGFRAYGRPATKCACASFCHIVLVVDDATSGNPYPDAYLYHRRNDLQPNFSRQYYAAFNLAALWATPGIEGLTIYVANSNNPTLTTFRLANPHPQPNALGAVK